MIDVGISCEIFIQSIVINSVYGSLEYVFVFVFVVYFFGGLLWIGNVIFGDVYCQVYIFVIEVFYYIQYCVNIQFFVGIVVGVVQVDFYLWISFQFGGDVVGLGCLVYLVVFFIGEVLVIYYGSRVI